MTKAEKQQSKKAKAKEFNAAAANTKNKSR
jgi:hypothetical protein